MVIDRCDLLRQAAPHGAVTVQQVEGIGDRARLDLVTGNRVKVKLAYLDPDRDSLPLVVYPADTLTQARCLYASPRHCERLLDLRDIGWDVAPSFHFGFAIRGFSRSTSVLSTDDYVAYWISRIHEVWTLRRESWDHEIRRLIDDGVMTGVGDAHFTAEFRDMGYTSATVRPGLLLTRRWPRRAARDPDFPLTVRTALRQILDALGESTAVIDGPARGSVDAQV